MPSGCRRQQFKARRVIARYLYERGYSLRYCSNEALARATVGTRAGSGSAWMRALTSRRRPMDLPIDPAAWDADVEREQGAWEEETE